MYFSAARLAVPRHVRAARSSSLRPRAIQDALRQVSAEDSAGFTVAACPGDCLDPQGCLSKPVEQPCQRRWQGASFWERYAAKQLSQLWELRWQQEQTQNLRQVLTK